MTDTTSTMAAASSIPDVTTTVPPALGVAERNGDILLPGNGAILSLTGDGVVARSTDGSRLRPPVLPHRVGLEDSPAWAPDGERLAWSSDSGTWVIDTWEGSERKISSVGQRCGAMFCHVAWSTDGSQIAVLGRDRVSFLDVSSGALLGVIDLPWLGAASGLVWSTDGDWLVLQDRIEFDGQPTGRLVAMHPDGTGLTEFYVGAVALSFAWSRLVDGVVALTVTEVLEDLPWELNVVTIPIDGSPVRHIAEAGRCYCLGFVAGLTVSPDGAVIAMNVPGTGPDVPGQGLYLMEVDGSDIRLIGPAGDGDPLWQPTGNPTG